MLIVHPLATVLSGVAKASFTPRAARFKFSPRLP
jgi:hypothetical protein